ncbi:hypothetical protein AB2B46_14230 [Kluyvera intermedia]|uniref:hypothetical protein n=1 Tax=Kluyvera intermedia TaxID=61648 RepID=UPI0034A5A563
MTDAQTDRLVTLILARLQPPVLVVVTPATGYRHAIRQRLAGCGERLHLALDSGIDDGEQWQALGDTQPDWQHALPQAPYKALLLPFLDYPLAAEVVNGTLQSPVACRLHDALLAGIPVLALRYHADPHSELNQLCGIVGDSKYAAHVKATLVRLADLGVTLCTMNEMLEKLALGAGISPPHASTTSRRYLTVTDIVNNPSLAGAPDAVLTDAAVDFIKAQKKN